VNKRESLFGKRIGAPQDGQYIARTPSFIADLLDPLDEDEIVPLFYTKMKILRAINLRPSQRKKGVVFLSHHGWLLLNN
jgi:hypothetical protein